MKSRVATTLSVAMVLAIASGAEVSAQSATTPACKVLSASDVKQATGIKDYDNGSDGDPEGQGAGGGSSCQWGGASFGGPSAPLLSLVLIRGKSYTEHRRTSKLAAGCKREMVSGVGDLAFFESCPPPDPDRSAPLFVKVGSNDLIVQMDIEKPATAASVRPKVISVAKAAVAKLARAR